MASDVGMAMEAMVAVMATVVAVITGNVLGTDIMVGETVPGTQWHRRPSACCYKSAFK
ncbi:hypothetical protein E2C01_101930 [Portunus trituberculatus]|uniref:Uncharacterized protein n=1 Tax=Portunus trituberculatus TaxID=210409 RepID=A0A5B7KG27_PORTR|nr:hypothetical protein [Portunus trituberculatus]